MKIVYASRTGNVQSFIDKLGADDVLKIETGTESVDEKFILVTYTDGYGDVPEEVLDFLQSNADKLAAVAASGDLSYDDAYCLAADVISDMYGVPVLLKFEFDGSQEDVQKFLEAISKM